jgi:hypothetical protein
MFYEVNLGKYHSEETFQNQKCLSLLLKIVNYTLDSFIKRHYVNIDNGFTYNYNTYALNTGDITYKDITFY